MRFSVLEHAFDLFKLDSAAFFDLDVATFTNMFDALAPLVNSREYWTFGASSVSNVSALRWSLMRLLAAPPFRQLDVLLHAAAVAFVRCVRGGHVRGRR